MPFSTKITGSTSENASYAVYTALFFVSKSLLITNIIVIKDLLKCKRQFVVSYRWARRDAKGFLSLRSEHRLACRVDEIVFVNCADRI